MQETKESRVPPLGLEDPLEKEMATHSSVPAWRIPWTEEPGGLQSIRVAESRTQLSRHELHLIGKLVICFRVLHLQVKKQIEIS